MPGGWMNTIIRPLMKMTNIKTFCKGLLAILALAVIFGSTSSGMTANNIDDKY